MYSLKIIYLDEGKTLLRLLAIMDKWNLLNVSSYLLALPNIKNNSVCCMLESEFRGGLHITHLGSEIFYENLSFVLFELGTLILTKVRFYFYSFKVKEIFA